MLRYMTAGESHGKGLVAILDGVPAGIKLDENFINGELARRMTGYGRGGRMRIESDKAEIISGSRKGITIGSPVAMLIENKDYKIEDLADIKCPRPGHADLAGMLKHGFSDARNVLERASARETAARVAAGAVAKILLRELGIEVAGHVTAIGSVKAAPGSLSVAQIRKSAETSDVRCADKKAAEAMKKEIDKAGEAGDTLGGAFEIVAEGVPPGLGSYAQWDKRMDGALARAVMSIPAVKAVSIGSGIECSSMKGSETHDPIGYDEKTGTFTRGSNNAGGIEGGLTNGAPVVVRGFMKPIATLGKPLASVDVDTGKKAKAAVERADVAAVPACAVVAEASVAIELASAFLDKFGRDSIGEMRRNYDAYMETLKER